MKGGGSMKNFEVIKLNNSEYDYMVIATTCISPISTLTDIQNELEDKSGRIIFDLTLINGTSSNRYITGGLSLLGSVAATISAMKDSTKLFGDVRENPGYFLWKIDKKNRRKW